MGVSILGVEIPPRYPEQALLELKQVFDIYDADQVLDLHLRLRRVGLAHRGMGQHVLGIIKHGHVLLLLLELRIQGLVILRAFLYLLISFFKILLETVVVSLKGLVIEKLVEVFEDPARLRLIEALFFLKDIPFYKQRLNVV